MNKNKIEPLLLGVLLVGVVGAIVENLVDYYLGIVVGMCLFAIDMLFDR